MTWPEGKNQSLCKGTESFWELEGLFGCYSGLFVWCCLSGGHGFWPDVCPTCSQKLQPRNVPSSFCPVPDQQKLFFPQKFPAFFKGKQARYLLQPKQTLPRCSLALTCFFLHLSVLRLPPGLVTHPISFRRGVTLWHTPPALGRRPGSCSSFRTINPQPCPVHLLPLSQFSISALKSSPQSTSFSWPSH